MIGISYPVLGFLPALGLIPQLEVSEDSFTQSPALKRKRISSEEAFHHILIRFVQPDLLRENGSASSALVNVTLFNYSPAVLRRNRISAALPARYGSLYFRIFSVCAGILHQHSRKQGSFLFRYALALIHVEEFDRSRWARRQPGERFKEHQPPEQPDQLSAPDP